MKYLLIMISLFIFFSTSAFAQSDLTERVTQLEQEVAQVKELLQHRYTCFAYCDTILRGRVSHDDSAVPKYVLSEGETLHEAFNQIIEGCRYYTAHIGERVGAYGPKLEEANPLNACK